VFFVTCKNSNSQNITESSTNTENHTNNHKSHRPLFSHFFFGFNNKTETKSKPNRNQTEAKRKARSEVEERRKGSRESRSEHTQARSDVFFCASKFSVVLLAFLPPNLTEVTMVAALSCSFVLFFFESLNLRSRLLCLVFVSSELRFE